MKPININLNQLRDILAGVTHAMPFSATALTDAKARKTDNPLGTIRKLTRVNGMVGAIYERAVQRQEVREGATTPTFQAKERQWGERISSALIFKDSKEGGSFYMSAQLNPSLKPKPLYLVERQTSPSARPKLVAVSREEVAPYLPPDRSKEKAASQGLEKELVYRDYRLDSLISLSLNGQKYRVRQTT